MEKIKYTGKVSTYLAISILWKLGTMGLVFKYSSNCYLILSK